MDEISALLITKALDGLSLRASAVAQNIANASTPSYTPLRVSFERELTEAARQGPDAIRQVRPSLQRETVAKTGSGTLRLDLEMASASETALRYSALVDVLSRQMQIKRLALTGGQ